MGKFRLVKNSSPNLVKVYFKLDPTDWHGHQSESVWAESISSNRCKILNTPFYAKGISFEDVVFVEEVDGVFEFKSVSIYGGHSTYRILLSTDIYENQFRDYWAPLKQLGCTYESASNGMILLAVDVPPETDIYQVYALLQRGEDDHVWDFQEGHCGHLLAR